MNNKIFSNKGQITVTTSNYSIIGNGSEMDEKEFLKAQQDRLQPVETKK